MVQNPIPVKQDSPQELENSPLSRLQVPGAASVEKPYSIYTSSEKWFIVSMAATAALFSPLTSSIYLPAIPTIATAFDKSIESINLTVTVYMVLQGVSPVLWGLLADRFGRRLILLACLLILSLTCIGLGLVPTSDYWFLMLLRGFQATGSASTIALGSGIVGDITTRAERGGFYALFFLGPQFGPAIGPVVGGVTAQALGWRWIFWLLCIASVACFLAIVVFLPETLRLLVGDGSVIPSKIHRPLISIVGAGRQDETTQLPLSTPFTNPFRILTYLDVMNLLIFSGIVCSLYYAVLATISTLFQETYPFLDETDIGLCYLAIGGGSIIGGLATGKLLNRDYRKMKEKLAQNASTDPVRPFTVDQVTKDEKFPIERARLHTVPFHMIVYATCCAGYGWCLEKKVNMAIPLVLQVIFATSGTAMMTIVQTLLIDLLPAQGSSVSACNNLVRCTMSATTVSVIQLTVNALGMGWTYVLFAGICFATPSMIWFALWIGPRCRAKRHAGQISIR